MRSDARFSHRSWLPLVAAMMLATGCKNKTTVINQPAAPAPQQPSPGVPQPEGDTPRDEAEFLVQEAYLQGRQEGMREAWAELPEDEREKRKAAARQRRANWVRRRQQLREEILTDVLADKYGQKFEELLENWKSQNPGETFECCKQEDEDVIEVDSPPPEEVVEADEPSAPDAASDSAAAADTGTDADTDTATDSQADTASDTGGSNDTDAHEMVAGSVDNLDCWSRLCPSVAEIIEGPPPEMQMRRGPRGRRGPGGWLGAGQGAGIDLEEIGVTLPEGDPIPEAELTKVLEEAHAKGVEAGKEFAGKSDEERMEYFKQRWAEREQRVKERMQERLEERLAEAVEDCQGDTETQGDCEGDDCEDAGGIGLTDSSADQASQDAGVDAAAAGQTTEDAAP